MTAAAATQMEVDAWARLEALDTQRSFIVKAPAGSGKTQLLTLRLLALLSTVEEPEEVLAITFTRAATAEMQDRVLKALKKAEAAGIAGDIDDDVEARLARAALEHARERGWALLEQPHRLNIQTIDSLCLKIAHGAPLLARLGGQLQPTEDAEALYALAARRTVEQLGSGQTELADALRHLLRLRDVKLDECEALIAEMLAKRDEWLSEFSAAALHDEHDWQALRERLEDPFRREHARVLGRLKQLLTGSHGEQLLELAAYACGNNPKAPIHALGTIARVEELELVEHFHCVREFLLTADNKWRKDVTVRHGFPAPANGGSKEHKNAYGFLIQDLEKVDGLLEALCDLEGLPAEKFSEEEWRTIRSVFTVLLRAAAELRVAFAERGKIDFVELGTTAEYALEDAEQCRRTSEGVRHLLVDEFQDTSRRQYTLLKKIVSAWEAGEQRTCFLVGDPMQSIYLFRQADLALFNEVVQHGLHNDTDTVLFTPLTLRRNFRSDAGIVSPLNAMFTQMAAVNRSGAREKSEFTPAVALEGTSEANAVTVFAQFEEETSAVEEAAKTVAVIRRHLPAMEKARAAGREYRIGVLVRAKKHVARIAEALRDAAIGYRAIELETLEERQEVRDVLSLVRALLSPIDRVAWLSVLRAPWCGLSLTDLHVLSGSDDPVLMKRPLPELLATELLAAQPLAYEDQALPPLLRQGWGTRPGGGFAGKTPAAPTTPTGLLSEDGRARAARVFETMQLATRQRFSGQFSAAPNGFAAWVERTWHSLGGPQCVDANEYENVQAFFRLLATITPDGIEAAPSLLQARLERFFAQPASEATEKTGVQLMTIHKAKGLGFDVVVVPGLERKTGSADSPLLQWMARTRYDNDARELLIAPLGNKGEKSGSTYRWVRRQREHEEREELNRLLYVACTRARKELYLSASLCTKDGKVEKPGKNTLLETGWAYLQPTFDQQFAAWQASLGPRLVAKTQAHADAGFAIAARAAGQVLRRLPADWGQGPLALHSHREEGARVWSSEEDSDSQRISAQGVVARAVGIVVHALFQQIAALPEQDGRREVQSSTEYWRNVAGALLRHHGMGPREMATLTARVLLLLRSATEDAAGRWILGQRRAAMSESGWTMVEDGVLRTVRADRVFIAGSEPLRSGDSHVWIVDYKTVDGRKSELADSDGGATLFHAPVLEARAEYEAQLAGYGRVLSEALKAERGAMLPLRFALYYPAVPHLDWWKA